MKEIGLSRLAIEKKLKWDGMSPSAAQMTVEKIFHRPPEPVSSGHGMNINSSFAGAGGRPPPDGYVCHKCNMPGHWIQDCRGAGKVAPSPGTPSGNDRASNIAITVDAAEEAKRKKRAERFGLQNKVNTADSSKGTDDTAPIQQDSVAQFLNSAAAQAYANSGGFPVPPGFVPFGYPGVPGQSPFFPMLVPPPNPPLPTAPLPDAPLPPETPPPDPPLPGSQPEAPPPITPSPNEAHPDASQSTLPQSDALTPALADEAQPGALKSDASQPPVLPSADAPQPDASQPTVPTQTAAPTPAALLPDEAQTDAPQPDASQPAAPIPEPLTATAPLRDNTQPSAPNSDASQAAVEQPYIPQTGADAATHETSTDLDGEYIV